MIPAHHLVISVSSMLGSGRLLEKLVILSPRRGTKISSVKLPGLATLIIPEDMEYQGPSAPGS